MKISNIPTKKHWAIILTKTVHIDDGYDGRVEDVLDYKVYTDYKSFCMEVETLMLTGKTFRAVAVDPYEVKVSIALNHEPVTRGN